MAKFIPYTFTKKDVIGYFKNDKQYENWIAGQVRSKKIVKVRNGLYVQVDVSGYPLMELRIADDQEKELVYDKIAESKVERDRLVSKWLTNENVLILVLRHYEKNSPSDWRIYAPIVNTPQFKNFSRCTALPMGCVAEKEDGDFVVYGKKFARIW